MWRLSGRVVSISSRKQSSAELIATLPRFSSGCWASVDGVRSVLRCAAAAASRPTPASSSAAIGIGSALQSRSFCDDPVPKWHARYPPRYFDFKAFRKKLRDKKEMISEAEVREVRRMYAKPPPEGWTVMTFLETMEYGDGAEEVAELFERWEDFISMTPVDARRLRNAGWHQRRKLARYITLFNHGLWPTVSPSEFQKRFAGERLEREGESWTETEDEKLLELAKLYDVNFGNPWLYLSWELQRREQDVRARYIELVVKPSERESSFELAITKASRPLLMNRKFRLMPPDLYIVPSEENFPVKKANFEVPAAFREYRQDDIF